MIITIVTLSILTVFTTIGALASWWFHRKGMADSIALQGPKRNPGQFTERVPVIMMNLAGLFIAPALVLPFIESGFDLAWPGVWLVLGQTVFILLCDDALFYWWHRLLHENKTLYRRIHRIHHKAYAPLPHPVEAGVGALGSIIGMLLLEFALGGINAWAFWGFVVWRQAHELNIHSGIKSVVLHRLFPISPTENHDLHHARPNCGNYGSLFGFWDLAMGTRAKESTGRSSST
jgi:methylsterol monooxygenase